MDLACSVARFSSPMMLTLLDAVLTQYCPFQRGRNCEDQHERGQCCRRMLMKIDDVVNPDRSEGEKKTPMRRFARLRPLICESCHFATSLGC